MTKRFVPPSFLAVGSGWTRFDQNCGFWSHTKARKSQLYIVEIFRHIAFILPKKTKLFMETEIFRVDEKVFFWRLSRRMRKISELNVGATLKSQPSRLNSTWTWTSPSLWRRSFSRTYSTNACHTSFREAHWILWSMTGLLICNRAHGAAEFKWKQRVCEPLQWRRFPEWT